MGHFKGSFYLKWSEGQEGNPQFADTKTIILSPQKEGNFINTTPDCGEWNTYLSQTHVVQQCKTWNGRNI